MQKVSKEFFLYSIAGGMGGGALLNMVATLAGSMTLSTLAFLASLYGGIVGLVLLYKMWEVIQPASTTPGVAVGFLFIPFFNFYWIFRAIWFWTKDYNAFRASRNLQTPPADEKMALALCVMVFVVIIFSSAVPVLGTLCALVNAGLAILFYMKGVEVVNALAESSPAAPPPPV